MNLSFPYWRLIRGPRDAFNYFLLRCQSSPRLMSFSFVRKILSKQFPFISVHPPRLEGLTVIIASDDPSQGLIFQELFLDDSYGNLTSLPFAPTDVIDCGAHIGMFSLLARHAFPEAKFSLFEPNPKNCRVLRETIAANQLDFSLFASAVSDRDGKVTFNADTSYGGQIDSDMPSQAGDLEVQCVDLARFIKDRSPDSLLLKMDIEGHEDVVLPAVIASLPPRTMIFFETHYGEGEWRMIEELMTRYGFSVKQTRWRAPFADGFAVREACTPSITPPERHALSSHLS